MVSRQDGIERRLRRVLLLGLPAVWLVSGVASAFLARLEVDELFDTRQVTMARVMMASLPVEEMDDHPHALPPMPAPSLLGRAQLEDEMIAVWDRAGRVRIADRGGRMFPRTPARNGFYEAEFGAEPWRLYTLYDAPSGWQVTVGQRLAERNELMLDASATPLIPWLLALPLLLLANASVIRRSLRPIQAITAEMSARRADDLRPLPSEAVPEELRPLMMAGNALLGRIAGLRQRERRFTDCAAHELRTPIAALRLQWDRLRKRPSIVPADLDTLGEGIERMSRLTSQLLELSRAEDRTAISTPVAIDWPTLVAQVTSECLPQAQNRAVELVCNWPTAGTGSAWPLAGDADLMQILLRNLVDNAIRHSPRASEVVLDLRPAGLAVIDHGSGVAPEALAHLGERFFRVEGDTTPGTGLGLAIVGQIARLHRLAVHYRATPGGGLTVELEPQTALVVATPPR
ncbi:MAG: two-component sensor histidine kinase [Rhodocyclaceae bacterium]|nr:two-component sensor histidine kinase [Rhodocyclaceae bacterium]